MRANFTRIFYTKTLYIFNGLCEYCCNLKKMKIFSKKVLTFG